MSKKLPAHPMQPIHKAKDRVIRFRSNAILRYLVDSGKLNLNEIAAMPFTNEDRMQVAQLIGYSVSGYGDLSYASRKSVAEADRIAESVLAESKA